jgi:hypothetical protein
MQLVRQVVFARPGLPEQTIVQLAAFRRQRHAALLNFTKPGSMGAQMFTGKNTGSSSALKLVWRSKTGTSRRGGPSIKIFGSIPYFGISSCTVDIQRARREMVDVATRETDHVGNQPVFIAQCQIGFLIDRRMAVPAEGFQCFLNKLTRLCVGELPG